MHPGWVGPQRASAAGFRFSRRSDGPSALEMAGYWRELTASSAGKTIGPFFPVGVVGFRSLEQDPDNPVYVKFVCRLSEKTGGLNCIAPDKMNASGMAGAGGWPGRFYRGLSN